ncbi:MAG: hypothetical protein KKG09_10625, partial [Verrucomicrobia bacterium]|nr:hypothetical protein [Verrucomicrobiota bacterium]MCG2679980.1 hypothetical protein [Kiritimatiellia bacterium]MBU4247365.1 hypothetical protein [Verrucomicrobiota bacterium]MBU4290614.1 hypothetical protein [Verrucomicrobiota bacterium]MBU4429225.1 hypothetical protein [Verrucomicrobiota bacterium]
MMTKKLLAGAGMVDITPEKGIQISGDIGRYRPVEEIREPLFARVLVLESGGTRCCLLQLDLCVTTIPWADEIRRRAAARTGLAPAAIMVHCAQNHAAPSLGHFMIRPESGLIPQEYPWLCGGDDRYNEPTVRKIVDAIVQAARSLRPVTLAVGRGVDGRVVFNRRFIMRDGKGLTHPGNCNPNVLQVEGPVDPEVGVASFVDTKGYTVALLLHHTCHPVHGYPCRYIIAGWPGVWAEAMRGGGPAPCLVLNGACGNIHHYNHLDPDYKDDHIRMGRMLAETAQRVLSRLQPMEGVPLKCKRAYLNLPYRHLKPAEIRAAQKILKRQPTPDWIDPVKRDAVKWDWMYAAATLDLHKYTETHRVFPYEIQAFRIGNLALVSWMGEPFVEAQLALKLKSPAPYTFVAHLSNGYVGYVPTRLAFRHGGFETRTANWSKLQPGALEAIEKKSVTLLRKLF